jgi:hypothetical protein
MEALNFRLGLPNDVLLLKHYATSRKVVGSIPDEIIEFFN